MAKTTDRMVVNGVEYKIMDASAREGLASAVSSAFSNATLIPENSNLDNYTTPGNYRVSNAETAETIDNMPIILGGRLTVLTLNASEAIHQWYIAGDNTWYTREYGSGSWTVWANVTNDRSSGVLLTDATKTVRILDNSDLNDYTTPGNYFVTSSASAQTISNMPKNMGGRLTVITLNVEQAVHQWFIAGDNTWYTRELSNGVWTGWTHIINDRSSGVLLTDATKTNRIPDNSDLDNYKTPGNYFVVSYPSAQTILHIPIKMGGRLTVMTLNVTQAIHQWFIAGDNTWHTREYSNGEWTQWTHFVKSDEVDQLIEAKSGSAAKSAYNALQPIIRSAPYDMTFANAYSPNTLKNYLGNTQNVHPSVRYFPNKFGGHSFWMAYTPYPFSADGYENPCVAYSDDGYSWTNIDGNPLDEPAGTGAEYNSDTELVYRQDTGVLECWYRYVGPNTVPPRVEYICRHTTTDGVNWSNKEVVFYEDSGSTVKLLSPSVVIENSKYCIWVVNMQDGYGIDYYEAPLSDVTNWTKIKTLSFSGIVDDGISVMPWHISVIKENGTYIMLMMCRNGKLIETTKCSLFLTTSEDNTTYTAPVKVVAGADNWDRYMYRASIVKVGDKYRIYYSASTGGSEDIYIGAVWGIGITEANGLSEFYGRYS